MSLLWILAYAQMACWVLVGAGAMLVVIGLVGIACSRYREDAE